MPPVSPDDDLIIPANIQGPLRTFLEGLKTRIVQDPDPSPPPPHVLSRHLVLERRRLRGIEAGFDAALDDLTDWPAVLHTRRWLTERAAEKNILVLCGVGGTGKSTAAAWAVEHKGGDFLKAWDVVQRSFDGALDRRLRESPCLAIDDLGTERLDQGGWALAAIHHLIDVRYDCLRPTIFTCNLSPKAFLERYGHATGERTARRLEQRGLFVPLVTKGPPAVRDGRP